MNSEHVLEPRSLVRILGATSGVTAAIAIVVACTVAAQARQWLGFSFAGVSPRIEEAAAILFNNGRFAAGIMAAAVLEQLRLRQAPAASRCAGACLLRTMVVGVEVVTLLAALLNAALVGLALGAYGWRMIPALLPHGPFEVLAYCVVANVFLNARRRRISTHEWVAAATVSMALLTIAAGLETYAWLG